MIRGVVTIHGVPLIEWEVANRSWKTIVDTGFNGDLELPALLKDKLKLRRRGQTESLLAGGQTIVQDLYGVRIPFEGKMRSAEVTFVDGNEILMGTRFLEEYRLEVNFVERTLLLERAK